MGSDLGVGDADLPYITVLPADTDTVATLTATAPDGTSTDVPVSGGALEPVAGTDPAESRQTWTADDPLEYTQPGRWVLTWTVTGTGEGVEDVEVFVVASPTAGGPTWTPGRSRVANYVPHRTLVRSAASTVTSEDEHAYTFDETTTPTGRQVDALIVDSAAWVSARVPNLTATHHALARAAAALLSAAWVERSWPNDDQSLQRANDMERRADLLMADLVSASNTETDSGDFGLDIAYPVWSFPVADPRYDDASYW
ncbi:hypothetical protein FHR83_006707 [Actinoplanes campanulatus]|uniref:Uncharacterized protein n=1 Tax=Actinoplanes campanulatus TaxID=113559 RepID=A0A7W5AMG4_9ACTN|nr:hypothetical protein [Actinoplanes campanulatus]MBB3099001.1 hypothetical protein [Actinoplanes campanulatus]GGN39502.1 hypothetical protein GCM10010109_67490 [Actinoplanes campanulatus]GID40161.1 hypothetical protein Aca09nite_66670 [Actinoplanes campanulatus]